MSGVWERRGRENEHNVSLLLLLLPPSFSPVRRRSRSQQVHRVVHLAREAAELVDGPHEELGLRAVLRELPLQQRLDDELLGFPIRRPQARVEPGGSGVF